MCPAGGGAYLFIRAGKRFPGNYSGSSVGPSVVSVYHPMFPVGQVIPTPFSGLRKISHKGFAQVGLVSKFCAMC
jgi:hypothetical protein